ncbi:MAG: hypothetical protein RL754_43 [Bacteroidota bacterium]|jgi:predicted transcriptional regulator
MHPLKKDEFRLVNRLRFEIKNMMEHVNKISTESGKLNQEEVERRLSVLAEYSRELADVQRAIDVEISKNL